MKQRQKARESPSMEAPGPLASVEVYMAITLAALRKRPHTSASALKCFLTCPRQYFFRYVEHAPASFRSASLAFGHAFHVSIGHYLLHSTEGAKVPAEQIVEIFREAFTSELSESAIPMLFDDEEQSVGALVDKAKEMLSAFVEQFPLPTRVLGVEVPFELRLQHPITGETAELPLIGAMDVIAEYDENRRVLELKTGKRKWSADQVDYDLQPTIYRRAAIAQGYKQAETELVVVTKAKKPALHRLRCARSERDEIELVDLALSVERAVRAGVSYRRRDWGCHACSHSGLCAP